MNLLTQSLVQGAIGFAIGAGTNDLAIRWVFYAIFGKKKHQIAAAVQKVISEELLTPEKIVERMKTPEVSNAIRDALEKAFANTKNNPLPSVNELLGSTDSSEGLDQLQKHIAELLADAGERYLASPSFREATLKPALIEQWNDLLAAGQEALLPGHTLRNLLAVPARMLATLLTIPQRETLCGALSDSFGLLIHSALTSEEIHKQIVAEINGFLKDLRSRPIGDLDRYLTDGAKPQLIDMLTRQIAAYAQEHVSEFLDKIRIFDIISESIIVYDEKKMESITRSVANRELFWVTFLGGVIGFLVGSLQGVILKALEHIF